MNSDKDGLKKFREAIEWFIALNSSEMELALTELKTETLQNMFQKFKSSPKAFETMVGEIDKAFTQLSQVKRLLEDDAKNEKPVNEEANKLVEASKDLFNNKRYIEALGKLEKAMALGLETENVYMLAGTAALYAKEMQVADRYANLVLRLNFNNPNALVLKALTIKEKEPAKALEYLERALKIRPGSAVILKYRDEISNLLMKKKAHQKPNTIEQKRNWKRAKMEREIQINDFSTSLIYPFRIISLSAGGCVVQGTGIPNNFQFTIELSSGKVWGLGEVIYTRKDGFTGIRFRDVSEADQTRIDEEVRNHPEGLKTN